MYKYLKRYWEVGLVVVAGLILLCMLVQSGLEAGWFSRGERSDATNLTGAGVTAPTYTPEDLLFETNKYRGNPLGLDPVLNDSAQRKCKDMAAKNEFEHGNWKDYIPDSRQFRGENLARGYTSAKEVLDAWAASPGHQKNLVRTEFTKVGFGVCSVGGETWVVQHLSD